MRIGYILLLCGTVLARDLGSYNVDLSKWSVSGFSSGACMATQLHVAYSAEIMGVGLIDGVAYYAAQGTRVKAEAVLEDASTVDVGSLVSTTASFVDFGDIDDTSSINSDKIYIFAGTLDSQIDPGNGPKIQQYYANYFTDTQTVFDMVAEHGFPTDNYGGPCDESSPPEYINNCGYNAAFALLDHIYGGLTQPSGSVALGGQFYEFDQNPFFTSSIPVYWSMDTIGYAYVPTACLSMEVCKLHVVFHGCLQGRMSIGDSFAINTGYNEVGELNNIIMLYPQAVITLPANQYGCWDWFGYNYYVPQWLYACQYSAQARSVYRMMRQASSQTWS